jgi:hypothetical protein
VFICFLYSNSWKSCCHMSLELLDASSPRLALYTPSFPFASLSHLPLSFRIHPCLLCSLRHKWASPTLLLGPVDMFVQSGAYTLSSLQFILCNSNLILFDNEHSFLDTMSTIQISIDRYQFTVGSSQLPILSYPNQEI